jgi:4-carboxymuconolactone decarboxylase
MTKRDWPSDIHPDSGYRLPPPSRDALDEAGQQVFDYFADPNSPSYVGLHGPGGVRLHSPRVAELLQPLNHYLRRESGIPSAVRELAILATARELDSQFEWTAHEPAALAAGVSAQTIDVIRHRRPLDGLAEREQVVIALGREMFGAHRVSAETFARAHREFGTKMLVDLVSVMGNYASTAALLCAFDVQLHPDWKPLLPVSRDRQPADSAGSQRRG